MEEDKVKQAMATKLVESMDTDRAKEILLRVIAGDDLFEAILDDGGGPPAEEPTKKKRPRRPRSDKGKTRANDFGPVPPVGSLT